MSLSSRGWPKGSKRSALAPHTSPFPAPPTPLSSPSLLSLPPLPPLFPLSLRRLSLVVSHAQRRQVKLVVLLACCHEVGTCVAQESKEGSSKSQKEALDSQERGSVTDVSCSWLCGLLEDLELPEVRWRQKVLDPELPEPARDGDRDCSCGCRHNCTCKSCSSTKDGSQQRKQKAKQGSAKPSQTLLSAGKAETAKLAAAQPAHLKSGGCRRGGTRAAQEQDQGAGELGGRALDAQWFCRRRDLAWSKLERRTSADAAEHSAGPAHQSHRVPGADCGRAQGSEWLFWQSSDKCLNAL